MDQIMVDYCIENILGSKFLWTFFVQPFEGTIFKLDVMKPDFKEYLLFA